MSRSKTALYWLAFAFFALTGCGNDDLRYRYGFDLNKLEFNLYTADMGVYPDTSVLDDPNNPFVGNRWVPRQSGPSSPTVESYPESTPGPPHLPQNLLVKSTLCCASSRGPLPTRAHA